MMKQPTNVEVREALIAAGVKNLRTYGYPECNAENILTDGIYKAFFASMLEDNKGNGEAIDTVINELLAVIGVARRLSLALQEGEPVAWITGESMMQLKRGGNDSRGTVPVHTKPSHVAKFPLFTHPAHIGNEGEEAIATLKEALGKVQQISGSALLAGERCPASDKIALYRIACDVGVDLQWAIGLLDGSESASPEGETKGSVDIEAIKDALDALDDYRTADLNHRNELIPIIDKIAAAIDGRALAAYKAIIASSLEALPVLGEEAKLESKDGDGWTEWGGGDEHPTAGRFRFRTRGGMEYTHYADLIDWKHVGIPSDIIAYKIRT